MQTQVLAIFGMTWHRVNTDRVFWHRMSNERNPNLTSRDKQNSWFKILVSQQRKREFWGRKRQSEENQPLDSVHLTFYEKRLGLYSLIQIRHDQFWFFRSLDFLIFSEFFGPPGGWPIMLKDSRALVEATSSIKKDERKNRNSSHVMWTRLYSAIIQLAKSE